MTYPGTLLWAAVISVSVSTVITLGIEWFAKPRLEARKERILDQQRNVRRLREVADAGATSISELHEKEYHHSHNPKVHNDMLKFRQEFKLLRFGLTDKDRVDAEALRDASLVLAEARTPEAWPTALENFVHHYAIFRYGRSEQKAYSKLIERGFVTDADA